MVCDVVCRGLRSLGKPYNGYFRECHRASQNSFTRENDTIESKFICWDDTYLHIKITTQQNSQ